MQPTLVTSGLIAIRYTDMPEFSSTESPASEKSESSFEIPSEAEPKRPGLPTRSASRRNTPKSPSSGPSQPATPTNEEHPMTEELPPPIPAKSPYRASRAMIQLQREIAETPEIEYEEERSFYFDDKERSFYFDDNSSDRWSIRTV